MSPIEVYREFEAAKLRQQDDRDRDITLAWHCVAIYARTMADKRVPPLDKLLTRRDTPKKPVAEKVRKERMRLHREAMLAFAKRHNAEQARRRARLTAVRTARAEKAERKTHGR